MVRETISFNIGDTVTTFKPHPCGGTKWKVVRTGADVKLTCLCCGRTVMLGRDKAVKAIKSVVEGGDGK